MSKVGERGVGEFLAALGAGNRIAAAQVLSRHGWEWDASLRVAGEALLEVTFGEASGASEALQRTVLDSTVALSETILCWQAFAHRFGAALATRELWACVDENSDSEKAAMVLGRIEGAAINPDSVKECLWRFERKREPVRTLGAIAVLESLAMNGWKPLTASWLSNHYERWFQSDTRLWSLILTGLVDTTQENRAGEWLGDWRAREDLNPPTLLGVALTLRGGVGMLPIAVEAHARALEVSAEGSAIIHAHRVWLALDEILAGRFEAADSMLSEIRANSLWGVHEEIFKLSLALRAVDRAPMETYGARRAELAGLLANVSFWKGRRPRAATNALKRLARLAFSRGGGIVPLLRAYEHEVVYWLSPLIGGGLLLWLAIRCGS